MPNSRLTYRLYNRERKRIRKDDFRASVFFEVYKNKKLLDRFKFDGRWGHRQKENEILSYLEKLKRKEKAVTIEDFKKGFTWSILDSQGTKLNKTQFSKAKQYSIYYMSQFLFSDSFFSGMSANDKRKLLKRIINETIKTVEKEERDKLEDEDIEFEEVTGGPPVGGEDFKVRTSYKCINSHAFGLTKISKNTLIYDDLLEISRVKAERVDMLDKVREDFKRLVERVWNTSKGTERIISVKVYSPVVNQDGEPIAMAFGSHDRDGLSEEDFQKQHNVYSKGVSMTRFKMSSLEQGLGQVDELLSKYDSKVDTYVGRSQGHGMAISGMTIENIVTSVQGLVEAGKSEAEAFYILDNLCADLL